MRIIALDSAKPDMVLGRDIYDAEGRILLSKGCELRPGYVRRLVELGINFVYVDDGRFGHVEIDETVAEETKQEAVQEVRRVMVRVQGGEDFSTRQVASTVNSIIDELLANPDNLIQLTDVRAMRDYTFSHSVGVAISVLVVGIAWGYQQPQLLELGVGAMLHDVGKSLVQQQVLTKPAKFSPSEYAEVKRHAILGYEALRQREDLSPAAAQIAYQHHERFDGTGYPRGLAGAEIDEYARLTAVADVFDAMTTDRVYRNRYLPHEVVEMLVAGSGTLFDPQVVDVFVKNTAVYPVGTLVQLSNKQVGVVVKCQRSFPTRPVVRVIHTDEYGATTLEDVDLMRELTLFVDSVLTKDPA